MRVVSFSEAVGYLCSWDTLLIGGSGGGHAVPEALIVAFGERSLLLSPINRVIKIVSQVDA